MATSRFWQARERGASGDEIGGMIINLDHVVAVDRDHGKMRVFITTPGVSLQIDAQMERSFLDALVAWWGLLDRFVNERVEDDPEQGTPR